MNFNRYINIPYKNLGRDINGLDCFGLVHLIYKEKRKIQLPDYSELLYDRQWYKKGKNHIIDSITTDWKEVSEPYKLYDLILFWATSNIGIVNHIGLYINDNKFIHVMENKSSMVSRLDNFWKSKVYTGLRYQKDSN